MKVIGLVILQCCIPILFAFGTHFTHKLKSKLKTKLKSKTEIDNDTFFRFAPDNDSLLIAQSYGQTPRFASSRTREDPPKDDAKDPKDAKGEKDEKDAKGGDAKDEKDGKDAKEKPGPPANFDEIVKDIKATDPNLKYEGWMRLALLTYNKEKVYPPVADASGQLHDFKFLNETEETPLDMMPVFDKQRKNFQYKKDKEVPMPDAFYFRVNQQNQIYYTETKDDSVILGAFHIIEFISTPTTNLDCLKIYGEDNENWMLCSVDGKCPNAWKYAFSSFFGDKFKGCPPSGPFKSDKVEPPKLTVTFQPMMIIPEAGTECKYDYNYKNSGMDWVCNCNEGFMQSPIDLPHYKVAKKDKKPMLFEYKTVDKDDLEVIYHVGQIRIRPINNKSLGQVRTPDGMQVFEAKEIVFHTPGEHTINKKKFDLEVQIIHETTSGDFKLALIVAIPFSRNPGEMHYVFEKIDYMNLPNPYNNNPGKLMKESLNCLDFMYDNQTFIDEQTAFNYYTYMGSQTTPPCAESTIWLIANQGAGISSTVITMFYDSLVDPTATGNVKNVGNNRIIQDARKRKIEYYKGQGEAEEIEIKSESLKDHYEKVKQEQPFYFFVDNDQPTNHDGALMVGDEELKKLGIIPDEPDGKFAKKKEKKT